LADDPNRLTIPETTGGIVDRLYDIKIRKTRASKIIALIEEEEKRLQNALIDVLDKDDTTGVSGKFGKATVSVKKVPYAKDWSAVYKYIIKTGEFDLLQKRLSTTAVEERETTIPGIEFLNVKKVNLRKA